MAAHQQLDWDVIGDEVYDSHGDLICNTSYLIALLDEAKYIIEELVPNEHSSNERVRRIMIFLNQT